MVGVTALDDGPGRRFDVFLLKRIDPEFCVQLTLARKSLVAFFRGTTVLAATLPPDLSPAFFDPRAMPNAYRELYGQRMGRSTFNAAFQRLGSLDDQAEGGGELYLGTFLSNEPYEEKLLLLDRTILAVSLAGAPLTVLLSLFLSRNITRPIADLLGGMERIRTGAWGTAGAFAGRLRDRPALSQLQRDGAGARPEPAPPSSECACGRRCS